MMHIVLIILVCEVVVLLALAIAFLAWTMRTWKW